MSSTTIVNQQYALERTAREYERLRAQARVWEPATERLLDRVGPAPGATCLDAGCGPGETMRLMARRVGPDGAVTGIDADAALGPLVESSLHRAGYRQCRFRVAQLSGDEPIPGAPYDLVYARLLLFHLPHRVNVLSRLWDAVAPGGHLVVQDYDLNAATVVPVLASAEEVLRVIVESFEALYCDIRAGVHLPQLFAAAGVGAPDGTDVAGHVEPLTTGHNLLEQVLRSLLPVAVAHDITDEARAAATLRELGQDAVRFPEYSTIWPLMFGAWKRKN
jgi:2-polyprenyl-3-methyl-5-hydroxy-6-metoxy-1,4-benzoquinol methylase